MRPVLDPVDCAVPGPAAPEPLPSWEQKMKRRCQQHLPILASTLCAHLKPPRIFLVWMAHISKIRWEKKPLE